MYDARIFLHENLRYTYLDMGAFVDIFPVDGLSTDNKKQIQLYTKQKFLYKLHMAMKYYLAKEWSISKNVMLLSKGIGFFYPLRKVITKLEKNFVLYDYQKSAQVAVILGEVKLFPIARSAFENLVLLEFEDIRFYVLDRYESYLAGLYGNFMQLPPLTEQVSEHRYTVGWKQVE